MKKIALLLAFAGLFLSAQPVWPRCAPLIRAGRRSHQRRQERERSSGHPEEEIKDYFLTSVFQPEELSILPVIPLDSSVARKTKTPVTDSGVLPR